jgi:hypothetical protein
MLCWVGCWRTFAAQDGFRHFQPKVGLFNQYKLCLKGPLLFFSFEQNGLYANGTIFPRAPWTTVFSRKTADIFFVDWRSLLNLGKTGHISCLRPCPGRTEASPADVKVEIVAKPYLESISTLTSAPEAPLHGRISSAPIFFFVEMGQFGHVKGSIFK